VLRPVTGTQLSMNVLDVEKFVTLYSRNGTGSSYAIGTLYGPDTVLELVAIDWQGYKVKGTIQVSVTSIRSLKPDGPLSKHARYYAQ
jgi:hypothetical protein